MARKRFKCRKCDRSFSMAAHLARHVNAIHKKAKKKVAKKPPKTRRVGRPKQAKKARRRAGSGVAARQPIGKGAARLLVQMRAHHAQLVTQQRVMAAQVEALTRAMKALQGV